MTRRRIIAAVIVVALIGALGAGYAYSTMNSTTEVTTATASRQPLTVTVNASGSIRPTRTVSVFAAVAGTLASVSTTDGSHVAKGAELARIDGAPLRTLVAQAESALAAARALPTSTWRLRAARIQAIEAAQSALNLARSNLADRVIKAPRAGLVSVPDSTQVGAATAPGAELFRIVGDGSLGFVAQVDEADIAGVIKARKAVVTLDAYPTPLAGSVTSIGATAVKTDTGGNAFEVRISLAPTKATLRQGMSGDVSIDTQQVPSALVVPVQAVLVDGGKRYVFVVGADNKLTRTEVTVGATTDTVVEITNGLTEGARVVTSALTGLKDGMNVHLR